jgi:hypothetical protein
MVIIRSFLPAERAPTAPKENVVSDKVRRVIGSNG